MSNPITPEGPDIPAQSADVQGWVAWVKEGIDTAISRVRSAAVYVIAPIVVVAMPDNILDDHHAAMPQQGMNHQQNNEERENKHHGEQHGGKDHNDKQHALLNLPKEAKERLSNNIAALAEMEKNKDDASIQKYLQKIQEEDPFLVPQDSVMDFDMGCIDDRQKRGKQHGVAGVGVVMDTEQHKVLVNSTVDEADRMAKRKGKTITIRVRPHARCGAAEMSLGAKKMEANPKTIEKEAMDAAVKTQKAIQQRIDDMSMGDPNIRDRVSVIVHPYDEKDILPTDHPAAGVLVNHRKNTVANLDRTKGPILYNISGILSPTAQKEAVISAIIAELSDHGKRGAGVPDAFRFKIIQAVDSKQDGERFKAETIAALRSHKEINALYEAGKIRIIIWEPVEKKVEKKKDTSWLNPLRQRLGQSEFLPNRQNLRADAARDRNAA